MVDLVVGMRGPGTQLITKRIIRDRYLMERDFSSSGISLAILSLPGTVPRVPGLMVYESGFVFHERRHLVR